MSDQPGHVASRPDDREAPPKMPRWVKTFVVVALVVVLVIVVLHLTGRGFRGHLPAREGAVEQQ
jgi:hypothetical protein